MASVGARAALRADENPLKPGKATAARPGTAALGNITNINAAAAKRVLRAKAPGKAPCARRAAAVRAEAPAAVPVPAPAPASQASADVSVEEEEAALCQAFSQALLGVQDVDQDDQGQPQLCSQYVKDIYSYLRDLEVQHPVRPDYMQGYEITEHMRAILVDWLVQVHSRFQLLQETLYLTVAILDRFLQVQPVSRRKLQLVGVTAMLVACKYEEMFAPEVGDFAYMTDNAFSKSQILRMEQVVLSSLHFQLGRPLPLHFLRRASKVADSDLQRHTLAKYLMELTLLDYHMVHYRPSEVAAASLLLAQLVLEGLAWTPAQQHYSTYSEAHLRPIAQLIAKNVLMVTEGRSKFTAVKNKYSRSQLLKISLLPQLSGAVLRNMAAPLLGPQDS